MQNSKWLLNHWLVQPAFLPAQAQEKPELSLTALPTVLQQGISPLTGFLLLPIQTAQPVSFVPDFAHLELGQCRLEPFTPQPLRNLNISGHNLLEFLPRRFWNPKPN
jgi:hypothetical protein